MAQFTDAVRLQTKMGEKLEIGELTLTPQSQYFQLKSPIGRFVYNRPTAVFYRKNDVTYRKPIADITRIVQMVLYSFSALFSIMGILFMFRKRKD